MPKRVIDGDALWVSEKLTRVPDKYRVEYAWLLPLAQANGCFECSPMQVWRMCYSALRTDWTIDDVTTMLNEFEQARMLFRWTDRAGKTFGFFVGAQKEGRLPKPSDRVKSAKQWQTGMVPAKELARFLGLTAKQVAEEYGELLATNSRHARDKNARKSPTGIGSGVGVGTGIGSGEGTGNGIGLGVGAAPLPSPSYNTPSTTPITSSPSNTQNDNTTTLHRSRFRFREEEEQESDPIPRRSRMNISTV